jgi:hypothetical protein
VGAWKDGCLDHIANAGKMVNRAGLGTNGYHFAGAGKVIKLLIPRDFLV